MSVAYKNWAGVYTFAAAAPSHPETIDEVRRLVASARKVHGVGSRHCFNGIADSAEMIAFDRMPMDVEIDREAGTATVNAGMRYAELGRALEREGLSLPNTASLPHITAAGGTATATHGSGDKRQNLAGAVSGLEFVTAEGDLLRVERGDPDFAGMVVHIGALGVVTRVTFDVQPTYRVRQEVFLDLEWDVLYAQFDEIFRSGDSVSIFTDYGETVNELWVKTIVKDDDDWQPRSELFGGRAATVQVHPVMRFDGTVCTEQLGVPGAWIDRMPHFVEAALTDAGNEMQAEYMLDRRHAVDGIRALRELADLVEPYILAAEFRTVAADDLWMSSSYARETVCLHYATRADAGVPDTMLPVVEAALAPFAPRPHWGKLFVATADELEPRYPKMNDFRALADRLDPHGKFRNPYLIEKVFGA